MTKPTPAKVRAIGSDVAYMKGIPMRGRMTDTTKRVLVWFWVGIVLAVTLGYLMGHSSQAKVTKVQEDVAKEWKTTAGLQRKVIRIQASTITTLTSEVATLQAQVRDLTTKTEADAKTIKALEQKAAAPKPKVTQPKASTATVPAGDWATVKASWYGPGLYGGRTADGTTYTQQTWCVAHKTLPFGTMLEISYNGKTVKVPVKDRGPFVAGRTLDLSAAVAQALGLSGVQSVKFRVVR